MQDLLGRAVAFYGMNGFEEARESVAACLQKRGPASPDGAELAIAQAMTALVGRLPQPDPALEAAESQLSLEVHGIHMMGTAGGTTSAQVPSADWALALKALGVLQSSVTDGDIHNPQQIGFVELSAADTPTSGLPVTAKLTGVQLAHFGAFYAESWRRNDWVWGRLDGSYRLIATLLDPEFLLESGAPNQIASSLSAIRGGTTDEVDEFANCLSTKLASLDAMLPGLERQTKSQELQTYIAGQIWQSRQTEILRTELSGLVASARADESAGMNFPPQTDSFLAAGEAITPASSAEDLLAAWNLSTVGQSQLEAQLKTRTFSKVGSQAATVGVGVFDDSIPWAPVRWALKPVRWALRIVNVIATKANRSR